MPRAKSIIFWVFNIPLWHLLPILQESPFNNQIALPPPSSPGALHCVCGLRCGQVFPFDTRHQCETQVSLLKPAMILGDCPLLDLHWNNILTFMKKSLFCEPGVTLRKCSIFNTYLPATFALSLTFINSFAWFYSVKCEVWASWIYLTDPGLSFWQQQSINKDI